MGLKSLADMSAKNKSFFDGSPYYFVLIRFNEKDVNKLQEISGQVIRIMKQQYGDNDDR